MPKLPAVESLSVTSAENCYVYNGTFYMLGDHGICAGSTKGRGSELDDSWIGMGVPEGRHFASGNSVA